MESCESPARPRPLVSAGAELGVQASIFFVPPVTLRFGAAFPLRSPDDQKTPSPDLYFTIGRSF